MALAGHEFLVAFKRPAGIADADGLWGGLVLMTLTMVLAVRRLRLR